MGTLRIFFCRRAALTMAIVALALAVRALIPAGYMTGSGSTGLTIELCSGTSGETAVIALPTDPSKNAHGKAQADSPCAFAALGLAAGPATDPIQLAIAIAFILALGLCRADAPAPARQALLRPPPRGPPPLAATKP
jgi:hypothetical protein